jgi:uncharacterized protein (TIGR02246 family)
MSSRSANGQRVTAAVLCTVLLLFTLACNHQSSDTRVTDEAAVRQLDAQWSKAAGANDVEAVVSYYSDDASLLPPNAPIVTGKPAIRAVWSTLLGPGVSLSWQPTGVEVARSGELAYVMGTYADTAKDDKGNTVSDHGKLVEVWKKQADGKWKVVADIYNSDLPARPTEAKK